MSKHILSKRQIINNEFEIQFFQEEVANGQIYRCKDVSGKLIRLKIYNAAKLKKHHFNNSGELIELEILRKINHPNIIKYLSQGEFNLGHDRYKYIATDFLSGESLTERLKRENPLSPYTALPIILDVLEALKYLHSLDNPVIHNSIMPDSIVLDYKQGTEKAILSNFHNARFFNNDLQDFHYDGVSVYYRASETFNNIVTPRSDIFSMGALFYNLITGIPPFHQASSYQIKTEEQLIDKVLEEREKPLKFSPLFEKTIDEHLKNVLRSALSNNIDNRFKSADEFSKALKRELSLSGSGVASKSSVSQKVNTRKKKSGYGFNAIAGMDDLKNVLFNDVIRALNEPEKYAEFGLTIPNGMLLYGPPGCGKTFFAQRFAEEVGYNFILVNPSDVQSKYINATQENLSNLFKQASENAPTIIFFDELDALVPTRETELHQMHAAAVNEFLAQMNSASERGIFVIAATNRPEKIDPALLRTGRIDKKFFIPPPDDKAREALFKIYMKNRPTDLDINYETLSGKTKNYVSSDIKFIVDEASRIALRSDTRINMDTILRVIANTKPSIKKSNLLYYRELEKKLYEDSEIDDTQTKKPFGFSLPENNNEE